MNFKKYHVSSNLAPPDWAENFVQRINSSLQAYITNNILYINASAGYGEYDTKYIFKTDWKENTQYTFNLEYRRDSSYTSSPMLQITYTDGTTTVFPRPINDGEWHNIYLTSEAGKTIKYFNVWYSSAWLEIKIDNFFVYEGTEEKPFEPYSSEVWHDIPHYIYNAESETWQEVTDVHERISGEWD